MAVNDEGVRAQSSLQVADLDRCSHSKPGKERLYEGGLKPVQQGHGVSYAVEGQHARRVVQVHAYPGGVGGADGFIHAVVPGGVSRVRAEEAPGFVVVPKQAQRAFALPADAPVGHADGELAAPLDLPVEATPGQSLPAEDLSEAVEPVRVVPVRLQVSCADHLPAVFRDVELFVGCARVQFQLAEVFDELRSGLGLRRRSVVHCHDLFDCSALPVQSSGLCRVHWHFIH